MAPWKEQTPVLEVPCSCGGQVLVIYSSSFKLMSFGKCDVAGPGGRHVYVARNLKLMANMAWQALLTTQRGDVAEPRNMTAYDSR